MSHYYLKAALACLLGFASVGARAQFVTFVPSQSATAYESKAVVTTLAGATDAKGSTDGPGAVARFSRLMGIAVAADGTLYLVDEENSTIRKATPAGEVTTLAGAAGTKGSADGPGAAARFYHPTGIAVDASGTLYVTDADNQTIRKITAAGDVTTLAGSVGHKGSADGAGAAAGFNLPHGLAVAADGTVYVADTYNHTIRKITPAGIVTTLAGSAGRKGSTDGTGALARFYHPAGVALDAQGTLYVADHGNQLIRKISPAGNVMTLAGTANQRGYANGLGAAARFRYPSSLAVDASGTLYVTDYMNMTIRKVTAAGEVTTLAGMVQYGGQVDGPGPAARFDSPWGVAIGASGVLYVAESNTIRIVK